MASTLAGSSLNRRLITVFVLSRSVRLYTAVDPIPIPVLHKHVCGLPSFAMCQ
jgi:hypothetical protein